MGGECIAEGAIKSAVVCETDKAYYSGGERETYQWMRAPAFKRGNVATAGLFRMFRPQRPSSAEKQLFS